MNNRDTFTGHPSEHDNIQIDRDEWKVTRVGIDGQKILLLS